MCSFLEESLKPPVFWSALAALGTLAAVLIALFLPLLNERKRVKKIERLIENEIQRNIDILKRTTGTQTLNTANGETK